MFKRIYSAVRVLDLFSGIGGFSLGLEKVGFKTIAFCEIEQSCHPLLKQKFPGVPIYEDIRTLSAARLVQDGLPKPEVICGGFPCQDISIAGKGAGITGLRSGLWQEYARIVGEILPRFVIVENTAALLGRGIGQILGNLASIGYCCEWHCIPAGAIGAWHKRDRIWIIAWSNVANINRNKWGLLQQRKTETSGCSPNVPDSNGQRLPIRNEIENCGPKSKTIITRSQLERAYTKNRSEQWAVEPEVGRVVDGISD